LGNGSSEAGLKLLVANLGAEPIKGEGDGMSDSIPTTIGGTQEARVANDEAFIPPEEVKRIGGGDAEKGAKKLYAMMDQIREERTGTKEQGKQIDPNKFMPGGSVKKYVAGGTTLPKTTPAAATGAESSLSNWAGDYVTNLMGQGAALANAPYQAYTGPLTAGASQLQTQGFTQAGNLRTPGSIGQAAGTAGGIANLAANMRYTPQTTDFLGGANMSGLGMAPSYGGASQGRSMGSPEPFAVDGGMTGGVMRPPMESSEPFAVDGGMTGGVMRQPKPDYSTMPVPEGGLMGRGAQQGSDIAQQYMNPYLQAALNPMMAEARREADISRMADAGRLTRAGAFGGSRQAIMESEGRRNLMDKQNQMLTTGYSTAYDKAMDQFNSDQDRRLKEAQFGSEFGLRGLDAQRNILKDQLSTGATQREIEQQGIAADLSEFNAQREFPYKQLQFQRDMISGLPTGSVTNTPAQLSGIAQLVSSVGGIDQLLRATGQQDLGSLLKNLGLNFGSSSGVALP
jgi:hypothetical protein